MPVTITDVEFWVVHERTTGAPEAGEEAGLAENERIWTAPTLTVTTAWVGPTPLVAVRV